MSQVMRGRGARLGVGSEAMRKFVAGIDYSDESAGALAEATRLAGESGMVVAVHVFEEGILHDLLRQASIDEENLLEGARRRLADFVDKYGGDYPIVEEVVVGHPYDALEEAVQRIGADCLALGVRGQAHRSAGPGELAVQCVRRSACPVMLVAEAGERGFREIVACIDFSSMSPRIAAAATEMAVREGAFLHFVHVYRPLGLIVGAMDQYMPSYPLLPEEEMIAGVRKELDAFVASLDLAPLNGRYRATVLDSLNVGGAVHAFADNRDDCLVILGTLGRTGIKRLLMGTTAEKIVRGARCSVLALKPE